MTPAYNIPHTNLLQQFHGYRVLTRVISVWRKVDIVHDKLNDGIYRSMFDE